MGPLCEPGRAENLGHPEMVSGIRGVEEHGSDTQLFATFAARLGERCV